MKFVTEIDGVPVAQYMRDFALALEERDRLNTVIEEMASKAGLERFGKASDPVPHWAVDADIWLREGKKIEAIKRIRSATGLGLREAKDCVDYAQEFGDWDLLRVLKHALQRKEQDKAQLYEMHENATAKVNDLKEEVIRLREAAPDNISAQQIKVILQDIFHPNVTNGGSRPEILSIDIKNEIYAVTHEETSDFAMHKRGTRIRAVYDFKPGTVDYRYSDAFLT